MSFKFKRFIVSVVVVLVFSTMTIGCGYEEDVNTEATKSSNEVAEKIENEVTRSTEPTEIVAEKVTEEPIEKPTEKVAEPTKPKEEPKKETVEEPKQESQESTESNLISLGTFKLTAYCNCSKCCGKWAGGATASGTMPKANRTIAVDTSVIPFGTKVVINGKTYIAEDTGSAIKGNKIDIYFDSHSAALSFGVQYAEVYIVKG